MSESSYRTIEKKCRILHQCTGMELLIFGSEKEVFFRMRKQNIPVYLHSYMEETFKIITEKLSDIQYNQVYFYKNSLEMSFIALCLDCGTSSMGSVIAGPFLSDSNYMHLLKPFVVANELPGTSRAVLSNYYQSLSVLTEEEQSSYGSLMLNIFHHDLLDEENVNEKDIEGDLTEIVRRESYEELYNSTKEQYDFEALLIEAVENGQIEEALKLKAQRSFPIQDVSYLHNAFRNGQILLSTLNTLYCRAVCRGGVPISYADSLSSKFITLIEKGRSLSDLKEVSRKMTVDYCESVRRFAIRGYTLHIRHAMDYIQQVLNEKIGLKEVAQKINVNPSYLSSCFKEETGMTITDYIQNERIKKACYLIDHNSESMTEVAMLVGYDDPNYFSRIFKKHTGMTPTEYRLK